MLATVRLIARLMAGGNKPHDMGTYAFTSNEHRSTELTPGETSSGPCEAQTQPCMRRRKPTATGSRLARKAATRREPQAQLLTARRGAHRTRGYRW